MLFSQAIIFFIPTINFLMCPIEPYNQLVNIILNASDYAIPSVNRHPIRSVTYHFQTFIKYLYYSPPLDLFIVKVPKANSNITFRPIAFSSVLCKVFKYILKNRLDWWLENNSNLSKNMYAFRKVRGCIKYLANFTGKIYQSFNNRQIFVTYFINIRAL